jgi:hypothetical protein
MLVMKSMTLTQAESKRRKAVDFLRRIGNDELAGQFDAMDARAYAERKGSQSQNEIEEFKKKGLDPTVSLFES